MDWTTDLNDPLRRDYLDKAGFEKLASRIGITNDTTVVFYGDKNNWFACYAFWLFEYYGHSNRKIMNGGRKKWVDEGRPLSRVKAGVAVRVKQLCASPEHQDRLRELGVFEDQIIRLLNTQTSFICQVCNARLAISDKLAQLILVEPLSA